MNHVLVWRQRLHKGVGDGEVLFMSQAHPVCVKCWMQIAWFRSRVLLGHTLSEEQGLTLQFQAADHGWMGFMEEDRQ